MDDKRICVLCQHCQNVDTAHRSTCESKCTEWLRKCCSPTEGTNSESFFGNGSSDFSEMDSRDGESFCSKASGLTDSWGMIDNFEYAPNSNQYLIVNNGDRILIGNYTKVYGDVTIVRNESDTLNSVNTSTNVFLNGIAVMVPTKNVSMVERVNWNAQPPTDPPFVLAAPAKFVIISHTATERGLTQAENVLIVRTMQTFHIESERWNDIAYNFLVGCDGRTYEGRGWGVIGDHTYGYNHLSIGIAFIGCFLKTLPSETALHQVKALIKWGVEVGAIDKDYVLVAQCQCAPTQSPGKRLFEEIQTWEHWRDSAFY